MPAGQDGFLEDLLAQYQRQRSALAELHQRMQQVSATALSPRRELSVTYSHSGGVTDIKFLNSAYRRLAPNELSDLIMATVREAKDKAATEAAEVIAPAVPNGLNPQDLVRGKLGADALMPADGPRLPQIVREQLERRS
jgi:DNA-binding protein YbaB